MELSDESVKLWAKTSGDGNLAWIPLYIHMRDSSEICSILWESWVPDSVKKRIVKGTSLNEGPTDETTVKRMCGFITAAHDIGKAIPAFQSRRIHNNEALTEFIRNRLLDAGLKFRTDLNDPAAIPHSMASEIILERMGIDRSLAVVTGGHHGVTPTRKEMRLLPDAYPNNLGTSSERWSSVQEELVGYCAKLNKLNLEDIKSVTFDVETQILLTSIVVVSDWIASNERLFPLLNKDRIDSDEYEKRLMNAKRALSLPVKWAVNGISDDKLFSRRFSFDPRPFQKSAEEMARSMKEPGLMVLEAPMGEGKTEAALIAAEILMERFGLGGIMFALPTQATADGLFPRIRRWLESASSNNEGFHTVFLAHGKSKYNQDYRSLKHIDFGTMSEKPQTDVVHNWFTGKRKGILSDFVIGTVDQVLMMGLKHKHTEMRHLGLSGKVVIIDECHAYDAYMGSYLAKTLKWLGAYRVPTILLSATLPPDRRNTLIRSYAEDKIEPCSMMSFSYPCVTVVDGQHVSVKSTERSGRTKSVSIRRITDSDVIPQIVQMSESGGYIGIIVNTVKRAQSLIDGLCKVIPCDEVRLLHSGFTSMDRSIRESDTLKALSSDERKKPPFRMIVVGTQVMEQSMDLDFDVLFTDICPIDLLLQRIGRLHRHENSRPPSMLEPACYVIDRTDGKFESGSEAVYGRYQLYNTRLLLKDRISIPEDIPQLVMAAYSEQGLEPPASFSDDYLDAQREQNDITLDKERRAKAFQISDPDRMKDILGWLENSVTDGDDGEKAMAAVRDGDRSVEVILIQRLGDGLFVLPWVQDHGGSRISKSDELDSDLAFTISGCKVPLPRAITARGTDRVIDQLRKVNEKEIPKLWSSSEWLNGEMFLVLDENLEAEIGDWIVRYDERKGMMIVERWRV